MYKELWLTKQKYKNLNFQLLFNSMTFTNNTYLPAHIEFQHSDFSILVDLGGFEPGSSALEADVLTTTTSRLTILISICHVLNLAYLHFLAFSLKYKLQRTFCKGNKICWNRNCQFKLMTTIFFFESLSKIRWGLCLHIYICR
jgi:hypothetical protein